MHCGISPGNSYFKKDTIHNLINFCASHFSLVCIKIPVGPSVHTFQALGYSASESYKKARMYGNVLKNHCKRSIEEVNACHPGVTFSIIDWNTEIEVSSSYQEYLKYLYELDQRNQEFHYDLQFDTRGVLEHYPHRKPVITDNTLEEGMKYVLKEFVFFLASESILKSNSNTFVYHKRWPVFEKLMSGHYDGIKRNFGFIIVTL